MFSTIKTWALGLVGVASAVMFGLLRYKSNKLDEVEQELESANDTIELHNKERVVSRAVIKNTASDMQRIRAEYEEQRREAVATLDDKPLSDDFVKLLRKRKDNTKDS